MAIIITIEEKIEKMSIATMSGFRLKNDFYGLL